MGSLFVKESYVVACGTGREGCALGGKGGKEKEKETRAT
jgi:hypothetical protein